MLSAVCGSFLYRHAADAPCRAVSKGDNLSKRCWLVEQTEESLKFVVIVADVAKRDM